MSSYQDNGRYPKRYEEVGRLLVYVTRLFAWESPPCLISPKLALSGCHGFAGGFHGHWFGQRITQAAAKRRAVWRNWHDSFLQVASGIRVIKVNRGEQRVTQ